MTKGELERGVVQVYQKVAEQETMLETMKHLKNIHNQLRGRRDGAR
jgi:hypothetical protein